MLPIGVRARQLKVRTLLLGMLLVLADHRPAHLSRVHQALITLPGDDQARLGVVTDWKHGPAPADLPADRAHLQPGRQGPQQGRTGRPAIRPAAAHLR